MSAYGSYMKKQKNDRSTVGGTYGIDCNYADEVLVPHEAIDRRFYEFAKPWTEDLFVTMDGKRCRPEFIATWSEPNEAMMDDFCGSKWGMKFSTVRSLWFQRLKLRYGLRTWHYIKLHGLG